MAQQASNSSFRARTELVIVPTVVTGRAGAHVTGLTRGDFVLLANRKEQKIAIFEEITTGTDTYQRATEEPGKFSNIVRPTSQVQRVTIIVFDLLHLQFADRVYAREQLCKLLASMADVGEPIAVLALTGGGVQMVHDFTTDPHLLAAAIAKSGRHGPDGTGSSEPPVDEVRQRVQGFQQAVDDVVSWDQAMGTAEALVGLQQIAQAFGGLPGRKPLIWITGALSLPSSQQEHERYERTMRMLNDAQFAVYPVDARGLVNPDYAPPSVGGSSNLRSYRRLSQERHWQSLLQYQYVAEMTGGQPFYNSNDLASEIRTATRDSSQYYLLGFYAGKAIKPGQYPLAVHVRRAGLEVRARTSFSKPKAGEEEQQSQNEMLLALRSPLDFTTLPLSARFTGIAPVDGVGEMNVHFALEIPPGSVQIDQDDGNHMLLNIAAAAVTGEGNVAAKVQETFEARLKSENALKIRQSGMTISRQLKVPPGKYRVRFVVRDALNGRVGALSAPLDVSP